MKERPILFSTPMVKVILDGRKTMTRRMIKPQIDEDDCLQLGHYHPTMIDSNGDEFPGPECFGLSNEVFSIKCPYGQPGDLLYVRESYFHYGFWAPNGTTKTGKKKMEFKGMPDAIRYIDSPPNHFRISCDKDSPNLPQWYKRLGRFMPRSASRITLRITDVRVERLIDITDEDCLKEGMLPDDPPDLFPAAIEQFFVLWESINGPGSWEKNPWVWVIEFERVKP